LPVVPLPPGPPNLPGPPNPPRLPKPKPKLHAPSTAGLMPIRLALTAPFDAVVPVAVTQTPTFSAAEVAGWVCVNVVAAVTATVSRTVEPFCRSRACTPIVVADTEVTVPRTNPPNLPDLPTLPPAGRFLPPKPREHVPLTGRLIVTVVAVMVCGDAEEDADEDGGEDADEDGGELDAAATAVTQSPTVTADSGTVTVRVNEVPEV
jgi:hypothetical protein